MPVILIWNALATPWVAPFNRLLSSVRVAGDLIEKWLRRQLDQAETLDRKTQDFPVIRFYNGALVAEVTPFQLGTIVPPVDLTLGAQMGRAAQAWNVPEHVRRRAAEARLLPDLIGVFETVTSSILASIDRWSTPRPERFDPANARFTDLFGLAALLFNRIGSNRAGILAAGTALRDGLRASEPASGGQQAAAAASEAGAAAAAPETPLEGSLAAYTAQAEDFLQLVAAALFVVPAVGALALEMAGDIVQRLRISALDRIQEIEASVMRWRLDFYERLYRGLNAFVDGTVLFMLALRDHVLELIGYNTRFALAFLSGVSTGISGFCRQLMPFWQSVADLVREVVDYIDRVLAIDIGFVIYNALVLFERIVDFIGDNWWEDPDKAPRYHAPPLTTIRLGDFFTNEGTGAAARTELGLAGRQLRDAYNGGNMLSRGIHMGLGSLGAGLHLPTLASAVIQFVDVLDRQRPRPAAAAPAAPAIVQMPDLVTTIVEPMRTGLLSAVGDMGNSVQSQVGNVFTAFGTLADGVARSAQGAALDAVRLGSLGQYRAIVAGSEALVARAFPDSPDSPATGLEAVGRAFAVWLSGGFEMIGSILGNYLGFLVDEWRARIEANEDSTFEAATSPRKLLDRARLGRVHVPELQIRVRGRPTDREAANDIAVGFRGAVRDAYASGELEFERLRGAAAAAAG